MYWCYYQHRSRESVSPVCGILNTQLGILYLIDIFSVSSLMCLNWESLKTLLGSLSLEVHFLIKWGAR